MTSLRDIDEEIGPHAAGPSIPSGYRPKIQLVAYEETIGGMPNGWIFLAVPNERGRYLKTDRCAAEVSCPVCESVPGEPCKGFETGDGYGGNVHFRRRDAWKQLRVAAARGLRIDIGESGRLGARLPVAIELEAFVPVRRRGGEAARPCPECKRLVTAVRGSVRTHDRGDGLVCAGSGRGWFQLKRVPIDGGEPHGR